MKLTPPKAITFWLSIILVVLGVAAPYIFSFVTAPIGLLVVVVGFVLLAFGNMVKGF